MIDNIFNDGWNLHTVPRNNAHPAVDIKQSKNEYTIIADLPGFEKSNINLSIDEGYLTIKANEEKVNDSNGRYMMKERSMRNYSRTFSLPDNALESKVSAKYTNGTLSITIPKSKEINKNVKQIKIN
tara:strand:+ start:370 stop:750 length:381 start_codon:yes stop_codon:yes gene_type:complete